MIADMRHGGNIFAVARKTDRRVHRLIDFSASINPLGPSPNAIRAIVTSLGLTTHYPDPDCVALREALTERHHLAPEQLLIGNGSAELIHLIPRALSIRHALIVGPTFSEYARAVCLEAGRVVRVDAQQADHYRPPVEKAIETVRRRGVTIDAVFLCNPNSPTGQGVHPEEVLDLARAGTRRGIWTILDETFIDYSEERSVIQELNHVRRLVVLRSFTKFYALPALRIGYLAGDKQVVERIKARQPPWSVNSLAQAAALASLNDVGYAERSRLFMQRERPYLMKRLNAIHGLTVYPSVANFLLIELPSPRTTREIGESLCRNGLIIRDCSSVPGLTSRTIRVAIRNSSQNRRLVATLRRLLIR